MEYKGPGRYIPIIYLLYSWGSPFGVTSIESLYKLPTGGVSRESWNIAHREYTIQGLYSFIPY